MPPHDLLPAVSWSRARPIGPALTGPWPGERDAPIYWVARYTWHLPGPPSSLRWSMCVERHYEIHLNGRLALRQRNFASGDRYLLAQSWGTALEPLLSAGPNGLDILVRSDPWRNKNHRTFRPLLIVEADATCAGQVACLQTDATWEVAILDGWREQIGRGANGTIHFERVRLRSPAGTGPAGSDATAAWQRAEEVELDAQAPRMLCWDDPPLRVDRHVPVGSAWSGACRLPPRALELPIPRPVADGSGGCTSVLEARFEVDHPTTFALAASALLDYVVELNGRPIDRRRGTPGPHQMSLPDYIVPAARGAVRAGANLLRLVIDRGPGSTGIRKILVASDLTALCAPDAWHDGNGRQSACNDRALSPATGLGGKLAVEGRRPVLVGDGQVRFEPEGSEGPPGSIVLDFGRTLRGRLNLGIAAEGPGRIHLGYGLTCERGAVDCDRMTLRAVDLLEVPAGPGVYHAFDERTFRYLDLVFDRFEAPVSIRDIVVEEPVFVDERRSGFETADPKLNAIWRASVRTAQVCSDELYVDNTEREHAQWADPLLACTQAGYYCFGAYRRPAKALAEMAMAQAPDGQLPGYAPGAWFPRRPLQCHMALVSTAFIAHYMHTGDDRFGRTMLDVILRIAAHWERHRTRDGLLTGLHTVFVDWGYNRYACRRGADAPVGVLTAMNGYCLGVLTDASRLAGLLGREADARELADRAAEMRVAMRTHLYDAALGLFLDGLDHAEAERCVSQPANCLAARYGAAPPGEEQAILRRIFAPPTGIDFIPSNALFAFRAAEILFECGCDDLALGWLRQNFGAMLEAGSDTLWETWDPHASLCQGTGAGPAWLLARYLAGLHPAEPGYARIGLDPHASGLDRLRATLTTPHGPVGIDWRAADGRVRVRLALPPALSGREVVTADGVDVQFVDAE